MKSIQSALRIFVLVGSLASFLGGWAMIAHAGKPAPVQPPTIVSDQASDALPPLQFNQTSRLQPIQPLQQSPSFSMPRLRTRGS